MMSLLFLCSGYPTTSYVSPVTSTSKVSQVKSPANSSGGSRVYSQSMFHQGNAPYPTSQSPPRRTSNNSSNPMQQSYMLGATPPFSTMGPGVGYVSSYGGSSPPLQSNYFQQPPGGSGDMMTMGLQHSSLFLQQQSLSVLGHGPPIARPLLPLDYLQQGQVPRNNPVGQPSYHQNRTHSQTESPMAGVQVQSPVPSSWQRLRPSNGRQF